MFDGTLALDNLDQLALLANDVCGFLGLATENRLVALEFRAELRIRYNVDSRTSSAHLLAHTVTFLAAHLLLHIAILGDAHALIHITRLADSLPNVVVFHVNLNLAALLSVFRAHPLTLLVGNPLADILAVAFAGPVAFAERAVDSFRHSLGNGSTWMEVVATLLRLRIADRRVIRSGSCGENGYSQRDGENIAEEVGATHFRLRFCV